MNRECNSLNESNSIPETRFCSPTKFLMSANAYLK